MTYIDTAPTAAALTASLAAQLRDPAHATFSEADLIRFLNDGLVEINRVYPLHTSENIDIVQDTYSYPTRFTSLYQVELWDADGLLTVIPFGEGYTSLDGWDLRGTTIVIPKPFTSDPFFSLHPSLALRLVGYGRRQKMTLITTDTELDSEAALGVLWFAEYRGFMSMTADRSLYTQWQTQANNSDVSMPMLLNLVANASQQWERHKSGLRTLRRQPVGSIAQV